MYSQIVSRRGRGINHACCAPTLVFRTEPGCGDLPVAPQARDSVGRCQTGELRRGSGKKNATDARIADTCSCNYRGHVLGVAHSRKKTAIYIEAKGYDYDTVCGTRRKYFSGPGSVGMWTASKLPRGGGDRESKVKYSYRSLVHIYPVTKGANHTNPGRTLHPTSYNIASNKDRSLTFYCRDRGR